MKASYAMASSAAGHPDAARDADRPDPDERNVSMAESCHDVKRQLPASDIDTANGCSAAQRRCYMTPGINATCEGVCVEFDPTGADSVARLLEESTIFAGLDAGVRELLASELEPRTVRRGEVVIRQGDTADGLYLVASGRLQAMLERDDGSEHVLGAVGRGEVSGEMALITNHPRSATVVATRDSHLHFLSSDAFGRIVQRHPSAMRVMATALIDRLMDTIRYGPARNRVTAITIVPLDRAIDVWEFGDRLAASLAPLIGRVRVVAQAEARSECGREASTLARAVWRERVEGAHDAVIYFGEPAPDPWTQECVHQADTVLLVALGTSQRGLRAVERDLHRRHAGLAPRTELVLLHDQSTRVPHATRSWLELRSVDRHHHVRVDRRGDYDRVARLLVGRGLGLVFGGGGARGAAHIGVLRALAEHALPIDAVGGASIGSIVAGAVARGDTPEEIATLLRNGVVARSPIDLTLPAVAFASGGRVTDQIREGAGDLDLEDLWLSCYCVSTNLTRGTLEVHTTGAAWTAVRSSFSVPGLFPPMVTDAGEVLVDGGLLSNLPVTPMRTAHSGIRVIAVDVSTRREFVPASSVPPSGVLSGWRFLASSLRGRAFENLTTLPRILMRLTELGSLGDDDRGDCYIRPPLDDISLLDFDKLDTLIHRGEQAAAAALAEWLARTSPVTMPLST
jgi:NTE family protein